MKKLEHKLLKIILISLMAVLFLYCFANAETYYVDTGGSNTTGNGSQGNPWQTIEYALTQVSYGDLIKINDGVYSEGQLNVPLGVSLTSTSQDAAKVKIYPKYDSQIHGNPLLKLTSAQGTNNPAGQTISYVTLDGDGTTGTPHVSEAIGIHDRDNVEIHNCIIKEFYYPIKGRRIRTIYTEVTTASNYWWNQWPQDPGLDGNDSSFDAVWPATAQNHAENIQIHHNTIINCGNNISVRDGYGIGLWCTKNSSIHHNTIDLRDKPGTECIGGNTPISGPGACLWNVDIYDNDLYVAFTTSVDYYSLGTIETWMHRGGCEFYNNTCNQGWSIILHKNSEVHDNVIIGDPASDCSPVENSTSTTKRGSWGIKIDHSSYTNIYNNYIEGQSAGFKLGANAGNKIMRENNVYNNVIINVCRRGFTIGAKKSCEVYNLNIYNNTIVGLYSQNPSPNYGSNQYDVLFLQLEDNNSIIDYEFKNNLISDIRGTIVGRARCVSGTGQSYAADVTNNMYDNTVTSGFWLDTDQGNPPCGTSLSSNNQHSPCFTGTGTNAEQYRLTGSSNAVDAGTNSVAAIVTEDYFGALRPYGSGYDIGMYEYGGTGISKEKSLMPNSLNLSVNSLSDNSVV